MTDARSSNKLPVICKNPSTSYLTTWIIFVFFWTKLIYFLFRNPGATSTRHQEWRDQKKLNYFYCKRSSLESMFGLNNRVLKIAKIIKILFVIYELVQKQKVHSKVLKIKNWIIFQSCYRLVQNLVLWIVKFIIILVVWSLNTDEEGLIGF